MCRSARSRFPVWQWGLPDDGEFAIEDLVSGNRWVWNGKQHAVRLDPAALPFLAWRIVPNSTSHAAVNGGEGDSAGDRTRGNV